VKRAKTLGQPCALESAVNGKKLHSNGHTNGSAKLAANGNGH